MNKQDSTSDRLNQQKSQQFLNDLAGSLGPPRANYYNSDHFESLFSLFDGDRDGHLSKKEMKNCVRKIFRKPTKKDNKIA